VVRLYEWERMRGVLYQLDAWLPPDSHLLFVAVRLINPNEVEVPTYWWSNIAVPETPECRVLVPAEAAYRHGHGGALDSVPIPYLDGRDVTYPAAAPVSTDYFFRVGESRRPWVACLDGGGRGLVQTSTRRLKGRKLFVWGQTPGGRRWQEFLSVPERPYLEIQAGLARTQGECLPLPAGARWHWVEAYGLMEADPAVVHGRDWAAATGAVEARLEALLPADALAEAEIAALAGFDQPPDVHLSLGSGWAALERLRRAADGEGPLAPAGLPFPSGGPGVEQAPWQALLSDGVFPQWDPAQGPGAYLVQPPWRRRLHDSLPRCDHWLTWLHLGVMAFAAGEIEAAEAAWKTSLERTPTAWALRNLAVLDRRAGLREEAAERWARALALAPDEPRLAIEAGSALLDAGRAREWLEQLSPRLRDHGRIRLLEARAWLDLGDLERTEAILRGALVVPDVREGEVSLTDLWWRLQELRLARAEGREVDDEVRRRARLVAPPADLDFRMS
jgi:tetratricopeptide (TPR) repeat protein